LRGCVWPTLRKRVPAPQGTLLSFSYGDAPRARRTKMLNFLSVPLRRQIHHGGGRLQRMKARSHSRANCRKNMVVEHVTQSRRHVITPLSFKVRDTYQAMAAYSSVLSKKFSKPAATRRLMLPTSSSMISQGFLLPSSTYSPVLNRCRILLYNLVNALSRKVELIGDCTQRLSAAMHFKNLEVSVRVCLGAWAKRAPLPVTNGLELSNLFLGKLSLTTALAEVTNPRAKRLWLTIHKLDVSRRHAAMSFTFEEVVEGYKGE